MCWSVHPAEQGAEPFLMKLCVQVAAARQKERRIVA